MSLDEQSKTLFFFLILFSYFSSMKNLILIVIAVLFASNVDAQYSTRWKRYRYEMVYGIGATNFLGELGGANREGTDFLRDF
jgi:hypothetical protein